MDMQDNLMIELVLCVYVCTCLHVSNNSKFVIAWYFCCVPLYIDKYQL